MCRERNHYLDRADAGIQKLFGGEERCREVGMGDAVSQVDDNCLAQISGLLATLEAHCDVLSETVQQLGLVSALLGQPK